MMTNKKSILIILSAIIVIGIIAMVFYISKPKQITPSKLDIPTISNVSISTDKKEYNKRENIDIFVINGLDEQILYHNVGGMFWGIEYFENGIWNKFGYEGRGGFQLTQKKVGDICSIAYYELMPPLELMPNSSISHQWNQRICSFEGFTESKIVRYIESGKYRLIFGYGFEMYNNDPLRISETKTVYSNTFTIK